MPAKGTANYEGVTNTQIMAELEGCLRRCSPINEKGRDKCYAEADRKRVELTRRERDPKVYGGRISRKSKNSRKSRTRRNRKY